MFNRLLCLAFFSLFLSFSTFFPISAMATTPNPIVITGDANLSDREEVQLPHSTSNHHFSSITIDDSIEMPLERLKTVPGMTIMQEGGPAQKSSLFIRGNESHHTLVLLDGMPQGDPTAPSGGYNFANLEGLSFDQIEILKGPQVVLYGHGALGGVIHLKTRDPKKGTNRTRLATRAGSYRSWQIQGLHEGSLISSPTEAPLTTRVPHYRLTAKMNGSAGDKTKAKSALKPYKGQTAEGSFAYDINDLHRVRFMAQTQSGYNGIDNYAGPGGECPNGKVEYDQKMVHSSFESLLSDKAQTEVAFNWRHFNRTAHNDFYHGLYKGDNHQASLKGKIHLSHAHELWMGGESYRDKALFAEGENEKTFTKEASTHALYTLHQWHPVNTNFTTRQGARIEHHSFFGKTLNYQLSPSYYIQPWEITLDAGFGHGNNYPTLYQHHAPIYGNHSLRPEKSDHFEFSFNRHNSSLTLFSNNYKDLIQYDFVTSRYGNIGKASSYGFEIASMQSIHSNIDLYENYTWTRAYQKPNRKYLLRRPHHQGNIKLVWKPMDSFFWQAEMQYVGERDDVENNGALIISKAHTVLNSEVGYHTKLFTLGLTLQNIANLNYEAVKGYTSPGRSFFVSLQIPGPK